MEPGLVCKKVVFANEDFALKYIKRLKESSTRQKIPQRAYLCEVCFNWHLTSSLEWNEEDDLVKKLKRDIAKLERKLLERDNRIKRLEREKEKHHAQVYELNQKLDTYRNIIAKHGKEVDNK